MPHHWTLASSKPHSQLEPPGVCQASASVCWQFSEVTLVLKLQEVSLNFKLNFKAVLVAT